MKVTVAALGALVAGIGGGLLAVEQTSIVPSEFATFLGVVWLAVLVTFGIRSTAAALLAGLSFVMLPAISQHYLPTWTGNVLPILFGLGAISAAKYPEGTLAEQSRIFRAWLLRMADRQQPPLFVEEDLSSDAGAANGDINAAAGAREGAVMVERVP
jgi:branched-chain amino acid transport system permease protein